jgi:hypothetical protein
MLGSRHALIGAKSALLALSLCLRHASVDCVRRLQRVRRSICPDATVFTQLSLLNSYPATSLRQILVRFGLRLILFADAG